MIKIKTKCILISIFTLTFSINGNTQNASKQSSCIGNDIVFGFFNGVKTTEKQAKEALKNITKTYMYSSPQSDPIEYDLFYNETEGFSDFVEVFEQRLQEQNGLLAGRFELFFSTLKGGGSWWDKITEALPMLQGLLTDLTDTARAMLIRDLTTDLGKPDSAKMYQAHRDQIERWVLADKKLLLLAHSQGNLFVNAAYQHALTLTEPRFVKVVHVAPASPQTSGDHTLANLDLVINGLRVVGNVPDITDSIPGYALRPPGLNNQRDALGHGLLEIYLNPELTVSRRVNAQVLAALDALHQAKQAPKTYPPYPPFVPVPFAQGPEPAAVFTPVPPTHAIETITQEKDQPMTFEARYRPPINGSLERWIWTYDSAWPVLLTQKIKGPGMDGSRICRTRTTDTALGLVKTYTCTDTHFLEKKRVAVESATELQQALEKASYKVTTRSLTFTPPAISFLIDDPIWMLRFSNGTFGSRFQLHQYGPAPEDAYIEMSYFDNRSVSSEKYRGGHDQWVNEMELRQWQDALRQHRELEERRANAYTAAKTAYDHRRDTCSTTTTGPSTPPNPTTPPTSPNTPGTEMPPTPTPA